MSICFLMPSRIAYGAAHTLQKCIHTQTECIYIYLSSQPYEFNELVFQISVQFQYVTEIDTNERTNDRCNNTTTHLRIHFKYLVYRDKDRMAQSEWRHTLQEHKRKKRIGSRKKSAKEIISHHLTQHTCTLYSSRHISSALIRQT